MSEIEPPFRCIFCSAEENFNSQEHIIPHSLGNDLIIYPAGWVCDGCNSKCGEFESRVLYNSIFGLERCRMGVISKKGKSARAKIQKMDFTAGSRPNAVELAGDLSKLPILLNADGESGFFLLSFHDKFNVDISRMLLKIGLCFLALDEVGRYKSGAAFWNNFANAKEFLLTGAGQPWPYFMLRKIPTQLVGCFSEAGEEYELMKSKGFDVFLYMIDDIPIFFFQYGHVFCGISLKDRDPAWRATLVRWDVDHVGCPVEFSEYNLWR